VALRARIEYQIAYGQTDYRLDPYNPRRSVGPEVGGAAASEFVMPGYVPPPEFAGPRPSPAGVLSDAPVEGPCRAIVYAPAGHQSATGYPLAAFLDMRSGPISRVLDWLIAQREIEPVLAVFVGPRSPGDERCSGAPARTFIDGKLLTWLASKHGATGSADRHAILAISYGAKDALDIALGSPAAFGRLGLLIPGRRIGQADIEAIAEHRDHRLSVAILAGRYDHANLPTARAVRKALADAGHIVNYTEVPEGHTAVTWRNHLRVVLVSLFGSSGQGAGRRYGRPER
jgi:enterochelin esterase-like enzyme